MVQPSQQQQWFDEEECLGFGVFVAELELIIGSSKGRKPDQTVLLELLQKLQASIISTRDTAVLKQHQKRCEAALYDIIYKGACAAVRHPARRLLGSQGAARAGRLVKGDLWQRATQLAQQQWLGGGS